MWGMGEAGEKDKEIWEGVKNGGIGIGKKNGNKQKKCKPLETIGNKGISPKGKWTGKESNFQEGIRRGIEGGGGRHLHYDDPDSMTI